MEAFDYKQLFESDEKADQTTLSSWIKPLFDEFNARVFEGKLPTPHIKWQSRMTRTAGNCKTSPPYEMRLSPIIIISTSRLAHVLLHEMCHLAVSVIDKVWDPHCPHGPKFKAWGKRANSLFANFPLLEVKAHHNFKLKKKCLYRCTVCHMVGKSTINRSSRALKNEKCKKCLAPVYLSIEDEQIDWQHTHTHTGQI